MKKSSKKTSIDISKNFIYQHHYEESTDLYRTINHDGIIIKCNKAYAKNLGYSISEVIGQSIFEHTADKSLDAMKNTFKTWKKTGMVLNREIWFKRKDGTTFPILMSASNLYDDNEKLIGSNTVIRNLSDVFHAKKEIEYYKRKRLQVIGELSARIAHDLRNPLMVVQGAIHLLENSLDKTGKTDRRFLMINTALSRMNHQIEDVLDFVSPKSMIMKKHSIIKILNLTIHRLEIPKKIRIILPKNDVKILCDLEKLEIVFVNLFANAIQAMPDSGKINIKIKEIQNLVEIKIQDCGTGIPEDLLPKIFDPLFTSKFSGTGLGLSSCQVIIEEHGGTIAVSTKLGKGTTFTITLPK